MKIIEGDLLTLANMGMFDVIIHGCNCFCTMGAGIARSIKDVFPEAYKADCKTVSGDYNKLGTFSYANIDVYDHSLIIVNGYTQYHYRHGIQCVKYAAIRSVFKHVKESFTGKRIGYPKIGAGLGGGDWNTIAKIIDEELIDEDHTLVILPKL